MSSHARFSVSKITSRQKKILDTLAPDEALDVIRMLAEKDSSLATRVEKMVTARLEKVDDEKVAKEVLGSLEAIDVHDVWDNAGRAPATAMWIRTSLPRRCSRKRWSRTKRR